MPLEQSAVPAGSQTAGQIKGPGGVYVDPVTGKQIPGMRALDAEALLRSEFDRIYRDPNGRPKPALGFVATPHYMKAWEDFKNTHEWKDGKAVPKSAAPSIGGIQQLYANPQGAALADLIGKASPVGSPEGLQAQMMKMFFGGQ